MNPRQHFTRITSLSFTLLLLEKKTRAPCSHYTILITIRFVLFQFSALQACYQLLRRVEHTVRLYATDRTAGRFLVLCQSTSFAEVMFASEIEDTPFIKTIPPVRFRSHTYFVTIGSTWWAYKWTGAFDTREDDGGSTAIMHGSA